MTWFVVVVLLMATTATVFLFLRKKQNSDSSFSSHSPLPTTSRKQPDPPTQGASLPDVSIVYEDAAGTRTERHITPLHRLAPGVIRAFCHLRNDERTFLLDRIRMVRDSGTGEILQKHLWIETLPEVQSQASSVERKTEVVLSLTADIQQDVVRISIDGPETEVSETSADDTRKNAEGWPSESVAGMVPKSGSFDGSLWLAEKTGRFRFPKFPHSKKYLVEIRDETDYRDQYWNHLDREERLRYDLDQFNRDIQSGGLIIEVDGFAELFKPGNHQKLGQSQAFLRLNSEALLETTEEGYEHSSSEPWWVASTDPAYEAVEEGYLERAKHVEPRDWWHNLKLPEIKQACQLAEIIVGSKKKEELIRELIERNAPYPEDAPLPYCPTTKCYGALRGAISTYITAIKDNANRFHPTYIAHIWDAALDANPYGQIRKAIREAIADQYWLERMQPE